MKTMRFQRHLSTSMSLVALATTLAVSQPALAQSAQGADEDESSTAIIVTARKREEDLLDVPLTVTAITAETLAAKGVTTMQDVAASTPGININDSSSGHADRGFQQVVLRGFTPVTTIASTTSLFIDGIPVSSPSAFTSISSPERIEILKGPQSAYFGRNTFAGAINVVNRMPGNDLSGSISGMIGTYNNYKLHADVEGAIVADKINLRLTGDYFSKDGSWKNPADGITLGDQSSISGSAMLVIKPTERITIKGYALLSRDKDGAPANGRYVAYDVRTGSGALVLANQSNCSFPGSNSGVLQTHTVPAVPRNYICGTIPNLINPVSGNVTNDAITSAFLAIPENRLVAPEDGVKGYGLLRQYRHYHASAEVELTDSLTATVLAGWNREFWNTMIDLDGFDGRLLTVGNPGVSPTSARGFYDFPFLVERKTADNSIEARLAYDSDKLQAVAGFSYLNATVQTGQRGTTGTLSAALTTAPGGISQNKTYGGFLGLTYEFTDSFSISAEGRYQVDKLLAFNGAAPVNITVPDLVPVGTYAPRALLASATYKNFTPRIIVNYDITPDTMIYASWSKGVNPAQFNSNLLTQPATTQQAAAQAGVRVAVEPETITNYEIGLKGMMLDGRLRYAISAYYAQWRKQINSVQLLLPGVVTPTVPNPAPVLTGGVLNSGSVDLKGVEMELAWRASDLISFELAAAINDSNIKDFRSVTLSQLTGIFDFSGKEMPYSSKYSMNMGVQLGDDIGGWEDASWFWRTDWSYKSGTWSGQANTSKSRGRNVVNMRAGITKGKVSLEAFVTNLFNNTNPTSLIDQTLFNPAEPFGVRANAALFYNLPDKRTFGMQAKIRF